ncbi:MULTISPECIES: RNA-binding cell elongation regulator Jag/EloR [unclassified Enterococcus]|uniref:RNA-binding cell elongation regulator Jag/EloR n=1 Tax=unclassified Enterococcus TaxID=2608891 RepID=UPI001554526E|nr:MULTISPECIES: RNA-binding cell elongation regulator Jag/EloR [unclassified Enterococcus]MBS7575914.1 protein jag [Enterococcus sp. MMGLQ5-2]MBS7583147.1 protein jag [Enterococcus sp. MMGLQ5-1]NPD11007.1 protein jag [Enterococcus sp. MMGLQ5-1]NPD35750.1 protein jag [Enterococcus sp. MMGLQ5-2]
MAIFSGKDVHEAIDKGLQELGLPRERVHINVIQKEKNGFFGFGKKEAKVNIEEISSHIRQQADRHAVRGIPDEVKAKSDKVPTASEATVELSQVIAAVKEAEANNIKVSKLEKKKIFEQKSDKIVPIAQEEVYTETIISNDPTSNTVPDLAVELLNESSKELINNQESIPEIHEVAEKLSIYLSEITKEMGVPTLIKVKESGRNLSLDLETSKQGTLIGKHGKTLNALQYIAQVFVHRHTEERINLIVNIGSYREKRKEILVKLATRTGEKVQRTGNPEFLEPMPAYERKLVHSVIAKNPYLTTHSEGEEPYRYLVIQKSKKQI